MHDTLPLLIKTDFPPLSRAHLDTLQLNLGYLCNQQCQHCHVNAGPNRKELMSAETMMAVKTFALQQGVRTLDLTGGAPEMNPLFRDLVAWASEEGIGVIDRCNLTIGAEPGQEDLFEFLAQHRVEVVASLPCYLQENVDRQRGKGVFDASVNALKALNRLGYGQQDSGLRLSLVYNPQGPSLPPSQVALEMDYKQRLKQDHGIVFSQLFTLANMPISRFGSMLVSKGLFDDYMGVLKGAHQDTNLPGVMCRSLLSVDWQGYVYDCDFNQMLGIHQAGSSQAVHIRELQGCNLEGHNIAIADHCYGCTAGQGSSCGGALD